MSDLQAVGGFQSGFTARTIKREEAKYPQFLICQHDCKRIIQLISHVSNEVEFEMCEKEAKHMAQVLVDAIGSSDKGE